MGFIQINNYSVTGDCSNLGLGEVFFNITGDSPGWAVTEISSSGLLPTSATTNTYYVNNLPAGSYFVEVIDSAFDTRIVPIYISSGTCVSIDVDGTYCGFDNGSLTATTATVYGPIDFYVYNIADNLYYSAIGVSNDYVFNGLSADTYYVIADDGGGCSGRSESCIIYSSTPINYDFYIANDTNCVSLGGNGKVFITGLTGNPPFTYLWSNGETTSSIENLVPGSYSVTVTDNNGCTLTKIAIVGDVPPIQFGSFIVTPPSCFTNDGEVEVTIVDGTAPYYFSGSNGQTIVTFSQTYTFTNLNPGNFTVFVQDAGLCSVLNSTVLATPNSFSVSSISTSNSSCNNNNGSINIVLNNSVPSGTFTYTLTDSLLNSTAQTTTLVVFSFNNLPSDTYTLTITDGTCTYNTTVTITNVELFTITASTTGTTCGFNNGSVQILASSGGILPYTYQITGQPPSSQTIFNNLTSGTYTATVTDNNGCTQTQIFNITPSSGVFFDFVTTQPITGNDGEIDVLIYNGEPPFTYSWSPNVGSQTGLLVTGLSAGTYSLQVTDNNGCVYTKSTTLQGTNLVSSYQVFNICDSNFQNANILGKRGILQMYNEGFYDLTFDDTNCTINSAEFILEVTVDGELKTINFYSSTGIEDYPTDVDWVNIVVDTLKTFEGIGDVVIDYQKNTIQIFNTCVLTGSSCNQQNVNLLSDAKITINLVIDYDISCVYCGLPPTPTPTPTPTVTPTITPTSTITPTPTVTPTVTPTITPTPTSSPIPVYPFVTTWEGLGDGSFAIKLPLIPPIDGGVYNFTVDWGDGSPVQIVNSWNSPGAGHTFSGPGPYTVTINGQIEGWSFNGTASSRLITSVLSWGPLKLGNNAFNFFGCSRLTLDTVIDVLDLTGVTNLTRMFAACQNLMSINNVEFWDTSLIQKFDVAFEKCQLFNDNLSDWDMSSTISLQGMFRGCGSFNNDGSSLLNTQWNVSNVTDMSYMFQNCDVFDQPLSSWDVSSVEYMNYMFDGAYDFNQNISSWNTQNVLEISGMFRNAIHFEQNIGSWNIQNVTDMSYMFANVQLSNTNYNALLIGWAAQPVQQDVIFDGGNSQYTISIAGTAKTTLTSAPNNWIITDGGGI